jgi:hypothetical protein
MLRHTRSHALILIASMSTVCAQSPHKSILRIGKIQPDAIVLERYALEPKETFTVSLNGITIPEIDAVTTKILGDYYFEPYNFRAGLLETGLANLTNKQTAPAEERAAQDKAAAARAGMWADQKTRIKFGYETPDPPKPAEPSAPPEPSAIEKTWSRFKTWSDHQWQRFTTWFAANWGNAASAMGVILTIATIITIAKRREIVIIGARGVGKSVLKAGLMRDIHNYKVGEPESTRGEETTKLKLTRRSTYYLRYCDIGGQYPQKMLERLAKRWYIFPIRRRMVLVIVYSPYEEQTQTAPDALFLERQYGWTESLITGFLRSKYGKRCNGVLVFINMFDRYDPDGTSTTKREEYKALFQRHCDILKDRHTNLRFVVGSGMKGWKTDESWDWITKTISGEVHA